ncbi:metal/formaldehyde-sensitive transcriptional repressor [Asticcacaulis sp. EMRT-3]|uniref:metal/formaldehyde-sensitive transcriptional repressor n=1 Tax=Asticcacaulis sp. EMRT-3 TaxID=3040349 RepID=UPI0024AEA7E6|nr:metal/formaldehyde-sensitive transcriptional repressor [Asticcacaulis sp. EMRT-3]MDI7774753.1 metal/formaldehyde-sensitive transcriptional repressor [Asticcacaulis sp. EMRT-3]
MHANKEKDKLLARVRRIKGQVEALERAFESEAESEKILHLIVAARGGISGLMGEVVEHHIRNHLADDPDQPGVLRPEAQQALIDIIHSYVK